LCAASYATAGSLTRSYGPATAVCLVIPASVPLVQDAPLLVEVANPMSDAPPSKKRPNWAAVTIVEPCDYVSGSTIVLCRLVEFVNGSVAICVS
jgi:hypothetical protein